MPRKPIDHSKTVIYCIRCLDTKVKACYVGRTAHFRHRKSQHKRTAEGAYPTRRGHNLKLYRVIRENGGWSNWEMVVMEQRECRNMDDAKAAEREWYDKLDASLNHDTPNGTPKEYEVKHRDERTAKKREKIACECGAVVSRNYLAEHRRTKKHIIRMALFTDNE